MLVGRKCLDFNRCQVARSALISTADMWVNHWANWINVTVDYNYLLLICLTSLSSRKSHLSWGDLEAGTLRSWDSASTIKLYHFWLKMWVSAFGSQLAGASIMPSLNLGVSVSRVSVSRVLVSWVSVSRISIVLEPTITYLDVCPHGQIERGHYGLCLIRIIPCHPRDECAAQPEGEQGSAAPNGANKATSHKVSLWERDSSLNENAVYVVPQLTLSLVWSMFKKLIGWCLYCKRNEWSDKLEYVAEFEGIKKRREFHQRFKDDRKTYPPEDMHPIDSMSPWIVVSLLLPQSKWQEISGPGLASTP